MTQRAPMWFHTQGMNSWVTGMAAGLARKVSLQDLEGNVLAASGDGDGEALRIELEVNGVHAAWLVVTPAPVNLKMQESLAKAVATFHALAEMRNSVADLVRTTATQWRELNVLYRSSDLLRGGVNAESVAQSLLAHMTRAIRETVGVVRYSSSGELGDKILVNCDAFNRDELNRNELNLDEISEWAQSLDEGVLIGGKDELRRLGFTGEAPLCSLLLAPLRSGGASYGAIALAGINNRMLRSDDLKLAHLLADQAGQAYANIALVAEARENERLRKELEVAAEIQSSILPPDHFKNDWLEMTGVCRPTAWVGGDAFIMIPAADAQMISGVADVSGHGISSALVMNAFMSQLKALAMTIDGPGSLLQATNNLIADRVGGMGMFVTAVLVRIAPDGSLVVANAGHPPLLVASPEGVVSQVEDGGLPLGIMNGEEYIETTAQVAPGGFVVAYSDGLTEARNHAGEMYGIDRMSGSLARQVVISESIDHVCDGMLADLAAFAGGEAIDDDMTLVVLRRTK